MTFSCEQLNFFKFSTVVLDEFPVAIRQAFVFMWDNLVAGVPNWDDSVAVRNLFVAKEGGKTKYVPTGKSIKEWDCTALFEATIFAKTFAMRDGTGKLRTLKELYAKSLPSGAFHHTVISSTGDQAETYYLALDQLRLLRNTLCHQISTRKIDKATFDDYLLLTKEAFTALGQSSTRIDEIGKLDEEDFPTARQKHLEDELMEEKDAAIKFQQIEDHLKKIESQAKDVGSDVKDVKIGVTDVKTQVEDVSSDVKELKTGVTDMKTLLEDVGTDVKDVKTGVTDMKTQVKDVGSHLIDVKTRVADMKTRVEDVGSDVKGVKTGITDMKTQVEDVGSDVKELKADFDHIKQAMQGEGVKGPLFPYSSSCIPDMIPHFVGRLEESQAILDHLTNVVTRLADVWGPPGFGKTSVAINVAHQLREMGVLVYFTSLRGMKSKDELVSKLLSMFADAKTPCFVSSSHWLIQCLQQLRNPSVLVLDNADDLLESGDAEVKEEVLEFTEEILSQCNHIKLLLTTRESLDYLSHKLPIHQERVGVLDVASSLSLVQSFFPDIYDDDCNTIVTVCRQVPLAIRLMCSTMRDERVSVNELVEELQIAPLVEVLDNASFPDNARLKIIINKSFQRLTDNEKHAFVSLAVFPRWFGIEEATTVLNTESVRTTKKIIRSLERKSLIDCCVEDSECSFTVHSLLRDFVDEKKIVDEAIGASFDAAQRRFYYVNITCFEEANELFFTRSREASAVMTWYSKSPLSSLLEGVRYDNLYPKVVEALSKAEVFLYAVVHDKEFLFEDLYDTALKEARKRRNEDDERKLLASKSFHHIAWFTGGRQSWDSSLYGRYTDAADCPVKLQFYHGIHQILCGDLDEGIASLLRSVDSLSTRGDHKFLKALGYGVLACLYKKPGADQEMNSHFSSLAKLECDFFDCVANQDDLSLGIIAFRFFLLAYLGPANNTNVTFIDELPKLALACLQCAGGKSQTVNISVSEQSLSNAFDILDRLSENPDIQQTLIPLIELMLEF